jgi:hypothetical protein
MSLLSKKLQIEVHNRRVVVQCFRHHGHNAKDKKILNIQASSACERWQPKNIKKLKTERQNVVFIE